MTERLTALLLVLVIALSAGCAVEEGQFGEIDDKPIQTTQTLPLEEMTVSYNSSYSLDPYSRNTELNLQLAKLCFEPLFAIDEEFDTYGLLASALTKISDTQYLITVNPARVFWDGSAVTAGDVVYSYNKAISGVNYSYITAAVLSVEERDGGVLVTLVKPNVNFANLMSFPVIKNNANKSVSDYIGSGLYIPSLGAADVLNLNSLHPRAQSASVKKITLVDSPDFEAMNDSVAAGLLNGFYADMSGNTLPIISGNVFGVRQNRVIYLGFNRGGSFSDVNLRSAVSMCIDRSRLVGYLGGYCEVATSLLHPAASEGVCSALKYDTTAVDAIFDELGELTAITFLVSESNDLKLRIAEEIAKQLTAGGFPVTLKKVNYEDYLAAIASGAFDMYLGDLPLSDDLSFDTLITASGTLGVSASATLIAARDNYLATGNDENLLSVYNSELPFSVLLYRKGMVAYSSNLVITAGDSFDYAFCNIEQTKVIRKVVSGE